MTDLTQDIILWGGVAGAIVAIIALIVKIVNAVKTGITLYRIMKQYRDEGRAVIFISHDLDEIISVCDTLTVLRDGHLIRTFQKEEFDEDLIRTSMIVQARTSAGPPVR